MRVNWIKPIFNWLHDDEHVTRAIALPGGLSVITSIILCCVQAGDLTFLGIIGCFLLYTFVWFLEWALVIPFLLGLVLSIGSFLIIFYKELKKLNRDD